MSATTPTARDDSHVSPEGRNPMSSATPTSQSRVQGGVIDPKMLLTSLPDAARKLDPRVMVHNPVMFVVEAGAVISTVLAVVDPSVFAWSIIIWLLLTVIFANLAEAMAEGRGKAQAETLRRCGPRPWRAAFSLTERRRASPVQPDGGRPGRRRGRGTHPVRR